MNSFKRIHQGQSGIGKLTFIVFATIIGVVLYCGYHILPFYYYYYELMNQMESVTRVASSETDQEIRKRLMYHINKMQIPIRRPEDLKIERDNGYMTISLAYQEVFYISWQGKDHDIHKFDFNAYVRKKY